MPAVIAMASAPQNTTRSTGRSGAEPPVIAPAAPSAPRNTIEPSASPIATRCSGSSAASSKGRAAPAVNIAAEVSAATTGARWSSR
jgi:hypothetical protein